jgi:hypothetical protein
MQTDSTTKAPAAIEIAPRRLHVVDNKNKKPARRVGSGYTPQVRDAAISMTYNPNIRASFAQIAGLLGITPTTLRSIIQRHTRPITPPVGRAEWSLEYRSAA